MIDPCKPIEDAVLMALPGTDDESFWGYNIYFGLQRIADRAGVDKETARFGCRRLRDKGLAVYSSGLFTEDGDVAGAGYSLTAKGRAAVDLIIQDKQ